MRSDPHKPNPRGGSGLCRIVLEQHQENKIEKTLQHIHDEIHITQSSTTKSTWQSSLDAITDAFTLLRDTIAIAP